MTPLVLLPGMMCDARLFGPQIAALSGRVPLVLCPRSRAHDSMAALAAEVLPHAPPYFASRASRWAASSPWKSCGSAARVARLALLDTNPLAENEAVRARRGPQIARALEGGLAAVMRDEMKPNYLADGPWQGGDPRPLHGHGPRSRA
jgi:hypothetical protein